MKDPRYQIESLKKWQDQVLEIAKKTLRRDGELQPVAFILTEKMNIDEKLQNMALLLKSKDTDELTSLANAEGVKPADTVILILDLVMGPEQTLGILKQTMPPEGGALLSAMEKAGHKFGVTNPAATVAKAVMRQFNLDIKDVAAIAIEMIIKQTDAIAYIKIDETWMVEAKNLTGEEINKYRLEHGTLENHPDATEAITSFLETTGLVRMVTIDFKRNRPKTGRIIGFGEPKEIVETVETAPKQRISGRFAHLFDKAKAQPKPPIAPGSN